MKTIKLITAAFIAILFAGVFAESCSYKKEPGLVKVCDTLSVVTYKLNVEPVLRSNCVGCHSSSDRNGDVSLESFNDVKQVVQSGKLFGVISHAPGFEQMPLGGNKLDPCVISDISRWIKAGAQNN